jgi:hypothetical protein
MLGIRIQIAQRSRSDQDGQWIEKRANRNMLSQIIATSLTGSRGPIFPSISQGRMVDTVGTQVATFKLASCKDASIWSSDPLSGSLNSQTPIASNPADLYACTSSLNVAPQVDTFERETHLRFAT